MISNHILKELFDRTSGCCHFCGDSVIFERYGLKNINDSTGVWEADHVAQKAKGGSKNYENCLPACWKCNRLRWHRKGNDIRDLLVLGLIAKDEIKKKTELGKKLINLKKIREGNNQKRRRIINSN